MPPATGKKEVGPQFPLLPLAITWGPVGGVSEGREGVKETKLDLAFRRWWKSWKNQG